MVRYPADQLETVAQEGKVSEHDLKKIQAALDARVKPTTPQSALFQAFLDATDLPEMLRTFRVVKEAAGLGGVTGAGFFDIFRTAVMPALNFKQKALFQVVEKKRKSLLDGYAPLTALTCACFGAGPVGLRCAIQLALLGAEVSVIERREKFTRYNILHLWDWITVDLLSLGATGGDLNGKCFVHIGTRDLQILLARFALVAGVNIETGLEVTGLNPPNAASGSRWVLTTVDTASNRVREYPVNAVFAAGGSNDAMTHALGFESTVLGTSSAVGLVAHLKNSRTEPERRLEEFSFARQYRQELFGTLSSRGMDLENVVYYQGNTHYFVMTPRRQSLLGYGVLRTDLAPPADLARDNIDQDKLRQFARGVAEFFGLPPSCEFVTDTAACQLFDFSTRKAAKTSCQVREDGRGNQCAVMLIGDAVLEPFWPEGLGINRGFHTAFDAVWVVQRYFASGRTANPTEMRTVREELFNISKTLSAFTKGNVVHEKVNAYALNPLTRYKGWRAK